MAAGLLLVGDPGGSDDPPDDPSATPAPLAAFISASNPPANAEPPPPRARGYQVGHEYEATDDDLLLAAFDDGTGDLAAGFLRHLSSELYLLSMRFADVDHGHQDEMTPHTVHVLLHRLSEQARAMAELHLRLRRRSTPRDPQP